MLNSGLYIGIEAQATWMTRHLGLESWAIPQPRSMYYFIVLGKTETIKASDQSRFLDLQTWSWNYQSWMKKSKFTRMIYGSWTGPIQEKANTFNKLIQKSNEI